jgi:hypothetical protein
MVGEVKKEEIISLIEELREISYNRGYDDGIIDLTTHFPQAPTEKQIKENFKLEKEVFNSIVKLINEG